MSEAEMKKILIKINNDYYENLFQRNDCVEGKIYQ